MKTKIIYTDRYYVDIGAHVFPTIKYRLIKDKLLKDISIINKIVFCEPKEADRIDLERVHTNEYLYKLETGTLTPGEIHALELPVSKELVRGAKLCAGGTILAVDAAIESGLGIHLGGGFHHAFPDHGEGFCVLNDVAIAIKKVLEEKKVKKALVIDCDIHQGNGTACIFQKEKRVFTFSIHQENNYPFYKPKSDMDIGLADRTKDGEYLDHLEKNIPRILASFKPEIIVYIAGADPYENDQIGNLGLTIPGLKKRDSLVYRQAKNYQVPLAVVLAGGYAAKREDTVQIHYNTVKEALVVFKE
ncbi:MAG: histone deacetylase [Candidatus Omnitrophota bacterium]